MRFDVVETMEHALDKVFSTHRDRLAETIVFLDDVERVECRSEVRHASGVVEQIYLWHGSPSVLPLLVRGMVPPNLLQWRQRTLWDEAGRLATWEITVPGLGNAVESRGTNRYEPFGSGTRILIDGDFQFRPGEVEGLAKAVPAAAVPMIEQVVVKMIVPLVKRSGAAVARLLQQDQRR
jgi:hypothetical protein